MKTIKTAWIFDVDGVLSDLVAEKNTQPEILDQIAILLERQEIVAFNTGRSIKWVSSSILNLLLAKIQNNELLQNLFIATEMGGMWSTFNPDGSINNYSDLSVKMPSDLIQQVKALMIDKYSQYMEFEEKTTMITTKIRTGSRLEEYKKDQIKLVDEFKKLISDSGLSDKLMVGTTNTGTNIQSVNLGKRRAIERIADWISKKDVEINNFITIGDSTSDLDMPIKLTELNLPVEFVYVGDKEEMAGKTYPFKITITNELYEKGTLEFLKSHA